jgi:hypothetical protein
MIRGLLINNLKSAALTNTYQLSSSGTLSVAIYISNITSAILRRNKLMLSTRIAAGETTVSELFVSAFNAPWQMQLRILPVSHISPELWRMNRAIGV